MLYEITVRRFLGSKGDRIESTEKQSRSAWLKKCLKIVIRRIDELDTQVPHKEALMRAAQGSYEEISSQPNPSWNLVYYLLQLIAALLGHIDLRGKPSTTLAYFQTYTQFYDVVYRRPNSAYRTTEDRENALSLRRKLMAQLEADGHNDFMIALVMHTSEYEVKKLHGSSPKAA